MKIASRILSLAVLLSVSAFYMACNKKNDPGISETDAQIQLLNGTWEASVVTYEGSAPALDHSDFAITISGTAGSSVLSYTVTGRPVGPNAWPAQGTLTFGSDVKEDLTRDDGIAISYNVQGSTLSLDFNFDKDQPYTQTREKSVSGDWHFEFTKQ